MEGSEKMGSADMASLQESMLEDYYSDNARKLHKVVDGILVRFGGLSDKDMDDFYSLANEVFVDVMKRHDGERSFDGFLYACLTNKIMTEITRRNREKRRADRLSASLDAAVGNAVCWKRCHRILTRLRKRPKHREGNCIRIKCGCT